VILYLVPLFIMYLVPSLFCTLYLRLFLHPVPSFILYLVPSFTLYPVSSFTLYPAPSFTLYPCISGIVCIVTGLYSSDIALLMLLPLPRLQVGELISSKGGVVAAQEVAPFLDIPSDFEVRPPNVRCLPSAQACSWVYPHAFSGLPQRSVLASTWRGCSTHPAKLLRPPALVLELWLVACRRVESYMLPVVQRLDGYPEVEGEQVRTRPAQWQALSVNEP